MKQSASRFGGFGFSDGSNNIGLRPALALRRCIEKNTSAALACATVRDVQRNYYLLTRGRMISPRKLFIIHERMPAHQQDYVTECLDASCDYLVDCPAALITTTSYLPHLLERLPWLEQMVELIPALDSAFSRCESAQAQPRHSGSRNTAVIQSWTDITLIPGARPADDLLLPPTAYHVGEPAVSCICLREGEGGRWLLTDHSNAAVVRAEETPAPELLPRLLRHCVDISGHQLAPHLARNFDVPAQWKVYPELAIRSLLIFRKNRCLTHGDILGIPKTIIWSDVLGLMF